MKIVLLLFIFLGTSTLKAQEISLFNSDGKAVAYIADDDDLTIYIWDGKPAAYLTNAGDDFNVYGFNGKHLGWFVKGIIYDHEGNAIGVTKNATSMYTEYEPYKSYKQYKPYKSYKEYAPYKPYWSNSWSRMTLRMFLAKGSDD